MRFNPAPSKSEKLIASYVVPGIVWDSSQVSVDVSTNTFTITGHGLVNGDKVSFGVLNLSDEPPKCGQQSGMSLYVINATADTFQLSTSSGGATLDFTTAGASGANRWKLFKDTGISSIVFSNLNVKKVRVIARGNVGVGTVASGAGFSGPFNMQQTLFAQDQFHLDAVYQINDSNGYSTTSVSGTSFRRYMLSGGGINYSNSNTVQHSTRSFSTLGNIGSLNLGFYGTGYYCAGSTVEVYAIE